MFPAMLMWERIAISVWRFALTAAPTDPCIGLPDGWWPRRHVLERSFRTPLVSSLRRECPGIVTMARAISTETRHICLYKISRERSFRGKVVAFQW
jgi:hypothetical protein